VTIDKCEHTFEELAASILPQHFSRLQQAMRAPVAAERLVGFKSATRDAVAAVGKSADFPGCYVFLVQSG
jgi:hypothetical protein